MIEEKEQSGTYYAFVQISGDLELVVEAYYHPPLWLPSREGETPVRVLVLELLTRAENAEEEDLTLIDLNDEVCVFFFEMGRRGSTSQHINVIKFLIHVVK